jgi:hypothetical protein
VTLLQQGEATVHAFVIVDPKESAGARIADYTAAMAAWSVAGLPGAAPRLY